MHNAHRGALKYETIFFVFIVFHVVGWTLAPLFARMNLPMDSLEGIIWSQKLVFGYERAPFLNAWVTALSVKLFGYTETGIYLTSQIAVAICFIALWQLAKKILPLPYALLSILLLEGFQYYNIGAIDFNDNVLQLPLWALASLFFYNALDENKVRHWVLLGVFSALAMLAKYYSGLLLASMLVFLLIPENRYCFRQKGPYFAVGVFLVLIFPHVFWLFQNDFLTMQYVFRRVGASDIPTWKNHLLNPLLFLRDEAYALIIPGLLFSTLYFKQSHENSKWMFFKSSPREFLVPTLTRFNRKFLIYLITGPFLLAIMLSFLTGIKLHIMWGSALFSLSGILLMGMFAPPLSPQKVIRFLIALLLLFFVAQVGYIFSLKNAKNTSSANFPGQVVAAELTNRWHQQYHQPLAYVVGDRWLGGNMAFYSSDHPIVLMDGDFRLAPWLTHVDFKSKGVLFIWDADEFGNQLPPSYRHLVDQQMAVTIQPFAWYLASHEKPINIGMLFFHCQREHYDCTKKN
jgi:4-amino-4-deoxy-L-arabinose transferase-like glycosyltransferase